MRKDMRKHIAQHIQPMLRPLTESVREKAHEIMAMQLDPRYCKGNLFKLMLGKPEEARELMKEYDDKSLLPELVHLSRHMQTKTAAAAAGPSEQVSAGSDYDDDDDDGDALYYDDGDVRVATNQADEAAMLAAAEAELRTFRCCNMLPRGQRPVEVVEEACFFLPPHL
eukprot:jgi/Tetstr1/458366/TSEL_044805.t1